MDPNIVATIALKSETTRLFSKGLARVDVTTIYGPRVGSDGGARTGVEET
jgi:hypothetical protein